MHFVIHHQNKDVSEIEVKEIKFYSKTGEHTVLENHKPVFVCLPEGNIVYTDEEERKNIIKIESASFLNITQTQCDLWNLA